MLIENGYHYRTLYLVVRLSELDLKTWILSFSFETITENENDNHFHSQNKYQIRLNGNDMEISLGIRLP